MVSVTLFAHGTSLDNENGISSGHSDIALSPLGIEQAKKLSEQTKDMHFNVVFCSDLQRAHITATLAFGSRFPIIQDARLRECSYGDYNGGLSSIVEPMQEAHAYTRFPNGESYEDVKARIADFLEMLKKDYAGKNVAIVAHKAPQLALDVLLKGKTWEQAFAEDWRNTKSWKPGWPYELS